MSLSDTELAAIREQFEDEGSVDLRRMRALLVEVDRLRRIETAAEAWAASWDEAGEEPGCPADSDLLAVVRGDDTGRTDG